MKSSGKNSEWKKARGLSSRFGAWKIYLSIVAIEIYYYYYYYYYIVAPFLSDSKALITCTYKIY